MVFVNSISMQPSYTQEEKLDKYARMTTAILNNIGHENKPQYCDFCNNPVSVDLDQLYTATFGKDSNEAKIKHYIGRDWIPLIGSMKSDAQGLPAGSRTLNACAKCLLAVQYLPQCSILVNGLLGLFQCTSVEFWYEWVKGLVLAVETNIVRTASGEKVETLGKAEGSGEVVNRLLEVMRNSRTYDPNASMIMYQYSNSGKNPDLKKQFIPSFSLNFLHEAINQGLREEIRTLMHLEHMKKTSYRYSFLNRITEQEDYYLLYPSAKDKHPSVSPELFELYQIYIRGYPIKSLRTAYKIAEYLKAKTDTEKLAINILTDGKKKSKVKKWIIDMASDGLITFDEYYDLFVSGSGNPWTLLRYYLQVDVSEFKAVGEMQHSEVVDPYKASVIRVGTMIYDRYVSERGTVRLGKLLTKFASGGIHRPWLVNQLERLADDNAGFDYSENWKALNAEEDLYNLLYLLRLLFIQLLR